MECPICYTENKPSYSLVCGHSFCYQCLKHWYQNSETQTCPLCRGSIFFRGFPRVKNKWDEEFIHKRARILNNTSLDEVLHTMNIIHSECSKVDEMKQRYISPHWLKFDFSMKNVKHIIKSPNADYTVVNNGKITEYLSMSITDLKKCV